MRILVHQRTEIRHTASHTHTHTHTHVTAADTKPRLRTALYSRGPWTSEGPLSQPVTPSLTSPGQLMRTV